MPWHGRVRAILEHLIREDVPGATALRQQLQSVQHSSPEMTAPTDVELEVDEDAPQAVPCTQVWPVQGRFERDGVELAIELQIHRGHLSMISLMTADAATDEEIDLAEQERALTVLEELTEWPEVSEIRLVHDGQA